VHYLWRMLRLPTFSILTVLLACAGQIGNIPIINSNEKYDPFGYAVIYSNPFKKGPPDYWKVENGLTYHIGKIAITDSTGKYSLHSFCLEDFYLNSNSFAVNWIAIVKLPIGKYYFHHYLPHNSSISHPDPFVPEPNVRLVISPNEITPVEIDFSRVDVNVKQDLYQKEVQIHNTPDYNLHDNIKIDSFNAYLIAMTNICSNSDPEKMGNLFIGIQLYKYFGEHNQQADNSVFNAYDKFPAFTKIGQWAIKKK
jgi:hypothetical protein